MKTLMPPHHLAVALLLAGLISPLALAAEDAELASDAQQLAMTMVNAQVTRVLVTADESFGGCMAGLKLTGNARLPAGCSPNFVTFSCSGQYTDPVRAYRMLDQAQLALAGGKPIVVYVDDSKKHSGYCFASRIDVFK
jgi:hypothetical protein